MAAARLPKKRRQQRFGAALGILPLDRRSHRRTQEEFERVRSLLFD